jgi:hypothetical protein
MRFYSCTSLRNWFLSSPQRTSQMFDKTLKFKPSSSYLRECWNSKCISQTLKNSRITIQLIIYYCILIIKISWIIANDAQKLWYPELRAWAYASRARNHKKPSLSMYIKARSSSLSLKLTPRAWAELPSLSLNYIRN